MSGPANPLPVEALCDYLRAQGFAGSAPLQVRVLAGGQSNPTYRITAGEGRDYVLRKKPPGTLIAPAHAVDREYRVMKALAETDVPVPRMLLYCESEELLGTPFYLMEFLQGRVLMDQSLSDMAREERGAIYREMNRVIAALHAVDYRAAGLGDYGKEGNYVGRQIALWSRQCRESTVPMNDAMCRLMDWLPSTCPRATKPHWCTATTGWTTSSSLLPSRVSSVCWTGNSPPWAIRWPTSHTSAWPGASRRACGAASAGWICRRWASRRKPNTSPGIAPPLVATRWTTGTTTWPTTCSA